MINKILKVFRREYQTLNRIEILKNNLLQNYKFLSSLNKGVKVATVLKSNGYGHGIGNIAGILDPLHPPFFCVDSLHEAYELLGLGIKTPVLIMGYVMGENLSVKKLPFIFTVYDLRMAESISRYQPKAEVHIFVDTGMNREGVKLMDLPQFLQDCSKFNLNITGLMSHLAIGGQPKHPLTRKQLREFNKAIMICQKAGLALRWIHLGGSNAILHTRPRGINLVRVGLALYGIDPMGQNDNLQPVLSLKTKIALIKKIQKGDSVGYNAKFVAKKDMTIGTLPIGYNDGVDRRLSAKGFVTVAGRSCPILGFASMNMTTIDLSKVENPSVGQEVVVFSESPGDPNSIENAAQIARTTPYDLLVHLVSSTRREII